MNIIKLICMQLVDQCQISPQKREWGEKQIRTNQSSVNQKHSSAFSRCSKEDKNRKEELQRLNTEAFTLEKQIEEAKHEQQLMMDFFNQLLTKEQGKKFSSKKLKKRTPEDVFLSFQCSKCGKIYTSDSCLKRHFRLKHDQLGDDPPKKYHTLHPEPDLRLPTAFSDPDSEMEGPLTLPQCQIKDNSSLQSSISS